ncbi:hypothetical protein E4T45_04138 [Aureobasidium sp. EXF-8846]|nr:hypothetical protein E4T45_04138 [Aureobasidium sp. EXF-8846]
MDASFAKIKDFNTNVRIQNQLLKWFPNTAPLFWSETCVEHNGFFGSHISSGNVVPSLKPSPASSSTTQRGPPSPSRSAAEHQEIVSTYFRFIVKILLKQVSSSGKDYIWHEMGFLSFSSGSRSTMLCFDVPDAVIAGLEHTLSASTEQPRGPFGLHIPLLGELVMLYDRSVWIMADKVRDIEKQRRKEAGNPILRTSSQPSTRSSLPDDDTKPKNPVRTTDDFEYLFEISRHVTHSVETTQIAAEVIERMRNACEALIFAHQDPTMVMRTQKLSFLHSMLKGLHARSMSNEKRLTSEQVLNKIKQSKFARNR